MPHLKPKRTKQPPAHDRVRTALRDVERSARGALRDVERSARRALRIFEH